MRQYNSAVTPTLARRSVSTLVVVITIALAGPDSVAGAPIP